MNRFLRTPVRVKAVSVSLLICVFPSVTPAAIQIDKQRLLSEARQRYYNVRRSGLSELRARVVPDWRVILGSPDDGSFKILNALHFQMSLDADSNFRIDHHADMIPASDKMAADFENIFKNMEQAVSQFMICWSVFTLTSPFPNDETNVMLAETANQFRLSHREGANQVFTTFDRNFRILELRTVGPNFTASLKPLLEESAHGFVLKGYSSVYESASGRTLVDVRIDNEEMSGVTLPRKVHVDTIYAGQPAQAEWSFDEYKVKVATKQD